MIYYISVLGVALGIYALKDKIQSIHYKFIKNKENIQPDYYVGLNYLINEEQDKALNIFLKLSKINKHTVETHLTLGNLYRKKGEVDRAICIHRNIQTRPDLNNAQKIQAILELAHDYFAAGVYDRSERLYTELISSKETKIISLESLCKIYQLQKNWHKAIEVSYVLIKENNQYIENEIAHYYCELAEISFYRDEIEKADHYLKKAIKCNKRSVRAHFMIAKHAYAQQQYNLAIKHLRLIEKYEHTFISETIELLASSHKKINDTAGIVQFINKREKTDISLSALIKFSYILLKYNSAEETLRFVTKVINSRISWFSIKKIFNIVDAQNYTARKALEILLELLSLFMDEKSVYQCQHCGFECMELYWQCPKCKYWSSIKPNIA